jgi:hypothetical protein
MNELVQRLTDGEHPVIVGGHQPDLADFKQRVEELGYVFIKFTQTRGGTDLGMRVDKQATNVSKADFAQGRGSVHVEGLLTLNYEHVRCIADIDLATLSGTGRLAIEEQKAEVGSSL